MVKIFVSNENHDFKYKMKCFQCGNEVSGDDYERYLEEESKKPVPKKPHLRYRGAFDKLGWRVVPPLEQFL